MKDRCRFDMGGRKCSILTGTKDCTGCKFRKTEDEFQADQVRTELILAKRGLKRFTDGERVYTEKIGDKGET